MRRFYSVATVRCGICALRVRRRAGSTSLSTGRDEPRSRCGLRSRHNTRASDDEDSPEVLRVDPAGGVDRKRGVGRPNRPIQEDFLLQRPVPADGVEEAIFAVGVDDARGVDRRLVDAPLEAVGMIRDTGDRAVRVPLTAQGVGVGETPIRERGSRPAT